MFFNKKEANPKISRCRNTQEEADNSSAAAASTSATAAQHVHVDERALRGELARHALASPRDARDAGPHGAADRHHAEREHRSGGATQPRPKPGTSVEEAEREPELLGAAVRDRAER